MKVKDGAIKEDQGKLQMIIRDLKQNLDITDDKRMLSGERNQSHLMLSPFEKKIANYQKSAEIRK
jgi:hypothetical protein